MQAVASCAHAGPLARSAAVAGCFAVAGAARLAGTQPATKTQNSGICARRRSSRAPCSPCASSVLWSHSWTTRGAGSAAGCWLALRLATNEASCSGARRSTRARRPYAAHPPSLPARGRLWATFPLILISALGDKTTTRGGK
jgi:hypothetical protein